MKKFFEELNRYKQQKHGTIMASQAMKLMIDDICSRTEMIDYSDRLNSEMIHSIAEFENLDFDHIQQVRVFGDFVCKMLELKYNTDVKPKLKTLYPESAVDN